MSGFRILGTGRHLPGRPYTNDDLARVMETDDEWIRQRTGITQRHYSPEGVGAVDLALEAAKAALESAECTAQDIDYILYNTMTPDHILPGSAPLLGARLGCPGVPALDLRTQCAAMLYSLQLADFLLSNGAMRRVLIVGAEAHAGFMPWRDWEVLEDGSRRAARADFERATKHRGFAILFGDGAGAMVLERDDRENTGLLGLDLHSDGRGFEQLFIPAGFRRRPYVSQSSIDEDTIMPSMSGRDLFKHAVTKLPASVRAACSAAGVTMDEIDWFIAHQANARINEGVRERLSIAPERIPSNIDRYGNTSSATIPILIDEMRRDGRLQPGQLLCFLALGAGIHWGAAVVRA
jgi:3-oxoacyl-[acyl-carrier-protein] synthase-3